jgi:ribosome biogenesis protein SSF1/2
VVLFNFVRRDVVQKDETNGKEGKDDADGDADMEDEEVEVRHYAIRTSPSALAMGAAGRMMGAGGISDSEAEDEAHQVDMPPSGLTRRRKKKNGNGSSTGTGGGGGSKSALKLVELGPRLRLKLYKVERLLSGGDVMYHAYMSKTPAEVVALKKRKDGEASLKKRRREEQEGNV